MRSSLTGSLAWRSAALAASAAALVLAGAGAALAQGCAMCASSLPGAEDPLSQGFNYSIFVFLGVTYSLIMLGGGSIAYMYWRAGAASRRRSGQILVLEAFRKEEPS